MISRLIAIMLKYFFGISLSIYSTIALFFLEYWRTNVQNFIDEILESGEDLLGEGKQVLNPVKDAADSIRKSADEIDKIAKNLQEQLPYRQKEITQSIKNANKALVELRPSISQVIEKVPDNVDGILQQVVSIEKLDPHINNLSEDIKNIRLIVYDSKDSDNKQNIVDIIGNIANELHKEDNSGSISKTLQEVGKEVENTSKNINEVSSLVVGDSAPITNSILDILEAISIIKIIVKSLDIKRGQLLREKLLGHKIRVPWGDMNLFPFGDEIKKFVDHTNNAKNKIKEVKKFDRETKDIADAVKSVGKGLQYSSNNVNNASTILLETKEIVMKIAPFLDKFADHIKVFWKEFHTIAKEIEPFGKNIKDQSKELKESIDENFPKLEESIANVTEQIESLDIKVSLNHVQNTTDEIKSIADLIYYKTDSGNQNDNNFYITINRILIIVENIIKIIKTRFKKVFLPLYFVVLCLHIFLFFTGLLLFIY